MAVLYGVGVGPGDPELLTLKAVRILRECEVIAVPTKEASQSIAFQIVSAAVPEISQKEIVSVDMPMTKDEGVLKAAHGKAAEAVIAILEKNKSIAFLTLGDPAIYSTYMYVHKVVRDKGHACEIVCGIPSFISAAAQIGESLILKDENLHIIPATFGIEESLQLPGTKVYMKAGTRLRELKEKLSKKDKRVFFIENCGMETEKVIEGADNIPDQAGYYSLLIVYDR